MLLLPGGNLIRWIQAWYDLWRKPANGDLEAPAADLHEVPQETQTGVVLLRLQAEAADPSRPQLNWVNRRVERLEFLDTRAVRRHISVDFNVPADAPALRVGHQEFKLVPITNLPKGNLIAFDLRDEHDDALWLPALDYSSKFLASTVDYWAREILGDASLSDDLSVIVRKEPAEHWREWHPFAAAADLIDAENRYRTASSDLATISDWLRALWSRNLSERLTWHHFRQVRALRKQWARAQRVRATAAEQLRQAQRNWELVPQVRRPPVWKLMTDEQFRSQLEELARNFVVLAAITSQAGTRRILKLTFESPAPFRRPKGVLHRIAQSAGWRCWPVDVLIGGRGGTHHLEAAAPPGVDIVRIQVTPWEEGRPVGPIVAPGGFPHVHVRVPAATPYRSQARIMLRVSRPGWLTTSWLVALVIVGVMGAGRLRLSVVFSTAKSAPPGGETGVAATLLLALLGVVAVVLARQGEHPLAARLLLLARILILTDAGVVLCATGALVLHRSQQPVTPTLWNWLLAISALVALLISVSQFAPRMRRGSE